MNGINSRIEQLIREQLIELKRDDLFREPLVAYSSAADSRYAELKKTIGEWHKLPTEILPDAQSVISYFIPFTREVADSPRKYDAPAIWGESYVVINDYFDVINEAVCNDLNQLGYSACSFSYAGDAPDDDDGPGPRSSWYLPPKTAWSHRSAAVIAGIGTLGANRLLITPKGSAGRLSSVFTSAPLISSSAQAKTYCSCIKNGKCGLCLKECPTAALSPNQLDYAKCAGRCIEMEKILGRDGATVCGKCISVCPFSYVV